MFREVAASVLMSGTQLSQKPQHRVSSIEPWHAGSRQDAPSAARHAVVWLHGAQSRGWGAPDPPTGRRTAAAAAWTATAAAVSVPDCSSVRTRTLQRSGRALSRARRSPQCRRTGAPHTAASACVGRARSARRSPLTRSYRRVPSSARLRPGTSRDRGAGPRSLCVARESDDNVWGHLVKARLCAAMVDDGPEMQL